MSDAAAAPPSSQPLLEVRGLTCRFGGLVAVSDLSFDVRDGEILGLIGPNGAGKSTTFNLLTGFCRPASGDIHFMGRPVKTLSPQRISRLGLVRTFQHSSMFRAMSVHDNILIGGIATDNGSNDAEARVHEIAARLGLESMLDEVASDLPHGYQRLLSIAIALAARPRLLCLDEPLTGLNQTEVNETLTIVRRLRDEMNISILFVEHNMRAVMSLCERLVVLESGRHLAQGTPAEITSNPAVIAAYLGNVD